VGLHRQANPVHQLKMANTVNGSVQVEGLRETIKGLEKLGVAVDDLKDVFAGIADEGAQLASSFAPKSSGKLASTIRGNRAKNKAVVTAGKARVPYAGAQNYGWPKRNIKPALFMQRADEALASRVPELLNQGINQAIEKAGLDD